MENRLHLFSCLSQFFIQYYSRYIFRNILVSKLVSKARSTSYKSYYCISLSNEKFFHPQHSTSNVTCVYERNELEIVSHTPFLHDSSAKVKVPNVFSSDGFMYIFVSIYSVPLLQITNILN